MDPDAIEEAVLEIQFLCNELPEIVVGRLADFKLWKGYQKQRLPIAEIPSAFRGSIPDLAFQPIIQFVGQNRIVRVGPAVISYHCKKPYAGWTNFYTELKELIELLFGSFDSFRATRLGLRYINAFSKELHGLVSVGDLNLVVGVGGQPLKDPLNLNFLKIAGQNYRVLVRVASPEFVTGLAAGAAALVDIDVHTPDGFVAESKDFVASWVENAHSHEKIEFFSLLHDEQISRLKVS